MGLTSDQIGVLVCAAIAAEKTFRRRATAWHVISGAPSSGKSALLQRLSASGQASVANPVHAVLRESHAAGIRDSDEAYAAFQARVANGVIASMQRLDPRQPAFLSCTLAEPLVYLAMRQIQWNISTIKLAAQVEFAKVFILEPTSGDSTCLDVQRCIADAYTALGQSPVVVPAFSDQERLEWILHQTCVVPYQRSEP